MPHLGAVAMELSGRWGLAAIVPGDRSRRNSQLQAVSLVRIMGSWGPQKEWLALWIETDWRYAPRDSATRRIQ